MATRSWYSQIVGGVTSIFGRAGAVVATLGDYAASLITNDSTVTGATVADALNTLKSAMTFLNPVIPDIDASGDPNYPAATKWDCGFVTVAGRIGGSSGKIVEIGDLVIAKATNPGGTEAAVGTSWTVLQANVINAVAGPTSATDAAIVLFDGTTGKLIKDSAVLLGSLATSTDTRITDWGFSRKLDGQSIALKVSAGTGVTFSGNNPVNILSALHGLSDNDQVLVSNTSDSAALANGLYPVTWVDLNNFTIPFNGTGTGGTCDFEFIIAGRDMITEKSSATGWELAGDRSGTITVKIYQATLTGAWAEITGGGISIASGMTASGTFGSPIALAKYEYLKFVVSANAGLHTILTVALKGTKVV